MAGFLLMSIDLASYGAISTVWWYGVVAIY